jgi:hypothetical protein
MSDVDEEREGTGRVHPDRSGHDLGVAVPCAQGHEWVVYGTALREGWLMLQCIGCGGLGTVVDPSTEEWSAAFHAPNRPYRWDDAARVSVQGTAAPRVIRSIEGPGCGCPSRSAPPADRGYARVPGGIWEHDRGLSDQDKAELYELAAFVGGAGLCSRRLPRFVRSREGHTGGRYSAATHAIVDRIAAWDARALHCPPPVVAKILREFAAWEPRHGPASPA